MGRRRQAVGRATAPPPVLQCQMDHDFRPRPSCPIRCWRSLTKNELIHSGFDVQLAQSGGRVVLHLKFDQISTLNRT